MFRPALIRICVLACFVCFALSALGAGELNVQVAKPNVGPALTDVPPASQPAKTSPELKAIADFIKKATGREIVQEPVAIGDAKLSALFPERKFYLLVFPQFPVARAVPEPLGARNVFVLDAKNAVTHMTDADALEKFFVVELPACKSDAEFKRAAAAWLRLSQELASDGMFQFSVSDDDTKVAAKGEGKVVTAVAKVTGGGRGEGGIFATMTFDKAGKLTDVMEELNLKAGIRPICQATKLLDADPVVRGMAERDLLVMGTSCRGYLAEQWQKADAKLRTEIERVWRQIVVEANGDPREWPLR